jgi:long-chain acyl-CoA synthetase
MTPGTLEADLRAAAVNQGSDTAIVAEGERLSYRELDRRASGFATALRDLGVRRGDRVAVVLRNSVESAVAIYGIMRAGAAFVPLNPTTKEDKLSHLLDNCAAVAAICDPDIADRVRAAGSRTADLRHLIVTGELTVAGDASFNALVAHDPETLEAILDVDLAAIIYTSGSTGVPKGAVFLHRNMHFVAGSIIEYLGLTSQDRILCVLPLSHTYGLYHLIMAVRVGATLVLEHGMTLPGRVVKALETEEITVLPGVPTVWQILLTLRGLSERELPHLRLLTNAGAALSVARLADVRNTFPDVRFFSMYGQTECKRVCYLPPDQLDKRPGSVGIAIPGTEVWIEDEDGNVVGPGEVGELMIRGDHVMQGYWRDAEATARKLRPTGFPGDRVLCSGDLFRTDEDGYLYFVARKDDVIKSRGEKIAPKEVEEVLYNAVGVREAAVVGVDDELLGQAIVAHVSASNGHELNETALRQHCAASLEDFMVPRRVVIHDDLPKTDNGKLDKLVLAALDAGGDGRLGKASARPPR